MKGLISIIVFFTMVSLSFSQSGYSLSHEVMGPAAGLVAGSSLSYQQSIGEPAIELFVLSPYTLTQGYLQPRFTPSQSITPAESNGVELYPNPVSESYNYKLTVRLYGQLGRSYYLMITNFAGAIVYTARMEYAGVHYDEIPVDMSALSNGTYIARIISYDGAIDRSFKVIKL